MKIARVAVSGINFSLDMPYDYSIPDEMADILCVGMMVKVPFSRSNTQREAIVLGFTNTSPFEKLKPITKVLEDRPRLSIEQIKLAAWMHDRFFCTFYDAARAMLPTGVWTKDGVRKANNKFQKVVKLAIASEEALAVAEQKPKNAIKQAEVLRALSDMDRLTVEDLKTLTNVSTQTLKALEKAGLIEIFEEEIISLEKIKNTKIKALPILNPAQNEVFEGLNTLMNEGKANVALLMGVTGSGKTQVYIRLIAEALSQGKSALMLVPEIALTPQMIESFTAYFGDNIAVIHSSLATRARYDEWKKIDEGSVKLVIGTRSAVFSPLKNLGIVIIDEEQEDTYKSESSPRYHARDIAQYRCFNDKALLLLGSATPNIESRYWAERGRYKFFTLTERYMEKPLPSVEIVDMKKELANGNGTAISQKLREELEKNIENGEQSILFLNRRGANKLISCSQCGYTYKCKNCSVSLTYHSYGRKLLCHYCGHTRRADDTCPECGGKLNHIGVGTQKLEEELKEIFPDVEILRMDADTVSKVGSHELMFKKFVEENMPIMIGTQMVAKGLNFPKVSLVGVVSADQSLYTGDYRAFERTFSLITQVIGRSGRFDTEGRAIIQTYTSENQLIKQAAAQDYESFYKSELDLRDLQGTPPFSELLTITVSGMDEKRVVECAINVKARLLNGLKDKNTKVLGPAPLPVLKINNRYRYRVTLCAEHGSGLRGLVSKTVIDLSKDKRFTSLSIYADNNTND